MYYFYTLVHIEVIKYSMIELLMKLPNIMHRILVPIVFQLWIEAGLLKVKIKINWL